jgi:hypothetical protein
VALDDLFSRESALVAAATAAVFSPRTRETFRRGAVLGVTGALKVGDVAAGVARGAARGVRSQTGSGGGSSRPRSGARSSSSSGKTGGNSSSRSSSSRSSPRRASSAKRGSAAT